MSEEYLDHAISKDPLSLNGSPDLFRSRGNGEDSLGLDAVVESVAGDGCGAGHVLVRRVGA